MAINLNKREFVLELEVMKELTITKIVCCRVAGEEGRLYRGGDKKCWWEISFLTHAPFLVLSLRSISSIALLEYMVLAFKSDDWMKGEFLSRFSSWNVWWWKMNSPIIIQVMLDRHSVYSAFFSNKWFNKLTEPCYSLLDSSPVKRILLIFLLVVSSHSRDMLSSMHLYASFNLYYSTPT